MVAPDDGFVVLVLVSVFDRNLLLNLQIPSQAISLEESSSYVTAAMLCSDFSFSAWDYTSDKPSIGCWVLGVEGSRVSWGCRRSESASREQRQREIFVYVSGTAFYQSTASISTSTNITKQALPYKLQ